MSKISVLYEKETGKSAYYIDDDGCRREEESFFEWRERKAEVSVELEEVLVSICYGINTGFEKAKLILEKVRKG